jgi:1,4-alpha-glucan branching enzyme
MAWGQANVTFRVDMNGVTDPFTTPEVNGSFNSWCGNCNAMTDIDNDGVWETTVNIPTGIHEYKFSYDSWTGQESLTAGTSCTVTNFGFTNRVVEVTGDMTLPIVCWQSCNSCAQPPRAVTFRVDMSNVSGFTTPEVNGTFNGWCGACSPMLDADNDGIYEATIYLPDGNYEFKYSYDNWTGQESLTPGSPCTATTGGFTNRTLSVNGSDVLMPIVCWNSCNLCSAPARSITFRVDMSNQTGYSIPEVNGTFNGWCGSSCNPMTDVNNDDIWETTIQLNDGTYEYKFAYDNWAGQESLTPGSSCTVTNGGFTNRFLNVTANEVLPVVCFNTCTTCAPPTRAVTFKVDMNNVVGYSVPEVNGTFNGWCGASCNPMTDADNDGIWETTIQLQDGNYQYKFAYDNWTNGGENLAPGSACTITDGGFTNRALTVNGADIELDPVCYGSCNLCSAPTRLVTFQVDMSNQSGYLIPEVNGTFNGWCGACAQMTDENNDDIYEIVIPLEDGVYEFKYAYDNWANGGESLEPGSPCTVTNGGFTNRSLVVNGSNIVLPVVCYGSCSECVQPVAVTFQVNMNQVSGYTTPEINGSFNGWCGGCFTMNDFDNDNIYTATTYLTPGTYEYKFAHDSWAGQEVLIPGLPCTVTNFGFTNRQLVLTTDTILPVVCWGSCGECIFNYDVTFVVDMTNVTGFTTPEVNGDFNGWCGGCFQLTDPNQDGIWSGTATIQAGLHEFKFAHDGWAGQESLTPGSPCTVTNFGFTNRSINVTGNMVLPVVCYGECSNCGYQVGNDSPYSAVSVSFSSNMVYPNCFTLSGNTANATDSPQSAGFSGKDTWYKFVAQSTAVSITLSSSTQDDVIELYSRSGSSYTLMPGGQENSSSGATDFERLNYNGLTVGQTYYVSVGSASEGSGGPFTLCIQQLMPGGCASVQPAGGFPLCSNFKSLYRGTAANGTSYNFTFSGVGGGASGSTSVSGTNGLIPLSSPALALQYGGIYDVQVDVNYNIANSAGTIEPILVLGSSNSNNCDNISIMSQPMVEVRSSQRCNAVLLRSNFLIGNPVANNPWPCGAINYTYEFTQVVSCSDGTTGASLPVEYTTALPNPYLPLGVLPGLSNNGAWNVRIRPNFIYGEGSYGPVQRISVNNTAASSVLDEEQAMDQQMKSTDAINAAIYPNPNNGNHINLNLTDIESENVNIHIIDAMGKVVYTQTFAVHGSLNTMISFDENLADGIYLVEFNFGGNVRTERMIVAK